MVMDRCRLRICVRTPFQTYSQVWLKYCTGSALMNNGGKIILVVPATRTKAHRSIFRLAVLGQHGEIPYEHLRESLDVVYHDIYTVFVTGQRWYWRAYLRRGMQICALERLFPSLYFVHSLSRYGSI
jgi:hypothetical protein